MIPEHQIKLIKSTKDRSEVYPQTDLYQFGEFAGFVVELGGYSDLTAVDPYSGDRLWVGEALAGGEPADFYNGLRKLIDAMEQSQFPGPPNEG